MATINQIIFYLEFSGQKNTYGNGIMEKRWKYLFIKATFHLKRLT